MRQKCTKTLNSAFFYKNLMKNLQSLPVRCIFVTFLYSFLPWVTDYFSDLTLCLVRRFVPACVCRVRMAAPRPANNKILQFKLVLLGEAAVGKSSLVLRFVKGHFQVFTASITRGIRKPKSKPKIKISTKFLPQNQNLNKHFNLKSKYKLNFGCKI